MKYLLTCITFFILNTSFCQNTSRTPKNNLKILSWNVYLLPNSTNLSINIKRSKKKERAQQICDIMKESDYDIIVFQEAFHIPSKNIIKKELLEQFPYQYGPINSAFIRTSSGVLIVSKIELTELAKTRYKNCTGIDCWAKKGAGIFEGNFLGKPFQIAATHLDSGKDSVKDKQYIQAYEKILKPTQKDGVAQIFCGDFNTSKSDIKRYNLMLKTYDAKDVITNSKQIFTNRENTAVIDYILIRKNNSSIKVLDKQIRKFKAKGKMVEMLKGLLSDHLAVEITVKL